MNESKISRRDFLRLSGLTGLITLNPVFAADELLNRSIVEMELGSNEESQVLMPWWVRRVQKPTIEVYWENLQRFDVRNAVLANGMNFADFVSPEEYTRLETISAENEKRRILEAQPGYTLKDQALSESIMASYSDNRFFLGPCQARTPEDRGSPKWEGSPEEATEMLRAAMRNFGAAQIGIVELDENTRKLIYSHDPDGKALIFEKTDQAYETENMRAIPYSVKYAIVYLIQIPLDAMKRAPTRLVTMAAHLTYERAKLVQNKTQEFLRGLGYQGLGQIIPCSLGITPAFAVMAGLGEMSRMNRLISPIFGPLVSIFLLLTDLPLAPDSPIDAGILKFCRNCKKCAEACPAGALSLADEPGLNPVGRWNNPGHQAYFDDAVKCYSHWRENAGSYCSICFAVCPFSKKDKALIYDLVKASISSTAIFDGFLRSMDDAFSYGQQRDPAEWWKLNLPEYGTNSERAT